MFADHTMKNVGRPDLDVKEDGKKWNANTTYQHEDCLTVVTLMKKGYTYNEVARELGVSVRTMTKWRANFPEFDDACETGRDWAQAHFEEKMRENLVTYVDKDSPRTVFDTRGYIFTMKSRFKVTDAQPPAQITILDEQSKQEALELITKLHKETY